MALTRICKITSQVKDVIVGSTCDACGRDAPEHHVFEPEGGFDSTYPSDGVRLEIVVCPPCLKAWVDSFKTSPTRFDSHAQDYVVQVMPGGGQARIESGFLLLPGETLTNSMLREADVCTDEDHPHKSKILDGSRVFKHMFDGALYYVKDVVWHAASKTHFILYREIDGSSVYYVRPLPDWFAVGAIADTPQSPHSYEEVSL